MVVYSPLLTFVSLVVILIYMAVKLAYFHTLKAMNVSLLTAQSQEASSFIENIRGIETIKAFCQEKNRQRIWQNRKIMSGLLQPSEGEVLVNGIGLSRFGLRRYRGLIGVMHQEDTLFSGSLAENISFFDADYDLEHVKHCARMAAIDHDIVSMNMNYDTPVGDMGSSLSGGQKQRILLARALYKLPKVLFLDEGTAHLDLITEAKVNQSLRQLAMTRVIVAHRPETVRLAERTINVADGCVTIDARISREAKMSQ